MATKLKNHILGIFVYAASVFFNDLIIGNQAKLKFVIIVLLIEIWVFYTFYVCLFFVFIKEKRSPYLSVLVFIISVLGTFSLLALYQYLKEPAQINKIFTRDYLSELISFHIHFSILALGYFYFERSLLNQRKSLLTEKNILLTEKKNIESENKILLLQDDKAALEIKLRQSDLNFLRAQINPHFLQNCLNFLYSDTRKTNPNAADAILLLSNIMRYSVADNSATGGMALLTDEINQVENVIQIHQLRFEKKLQIAFSKEGNYEHKQIAPMILLTLVENLIKYGDLNNNQHPAKIDCSINDKEKKVFFTTSNKKAYSTELISTGLGLKNVRERLSLIWGDNFTLEKEESENYYTVKLCMPYTDI